MNDSYNASLLKVYNEDAKKVIEHIKECMLEVTDSKSMAYEAYTTSCLLYLQNKQYLDKINGVACVLTALCFVNNEDILMTKFCKKAAKFLLTYLKTIGV